MKNKDLIDDKLAADINKKTSAVTAMYQNAAAIGTEEMTQSDMNTPILKIIQPNTQNIENKIDGSFYRSDTRETLDSVKVNLVYVTTKEVENYNKNGMETVKIYFGFYAGTQEPFKMYCRGWAMAGHRAFQTEIAHIKHKYNVPMLALTVELTTVKQMGTIADTGKPYTTYKPVFSVIEIEGQPGIEMDSERISFLVEAADRFKGVASTSSANDEEQNEIPANPDTQPNPDNPSGDLPFE